MAKKSKVARYRSKRKNAPAKASVTGNLADFGVRAGAGFAGYAANRFLSRAVYTMMLKKFPGVSKHVAVASSLGGAFGVGILGEKWDRISEYKDEVMLGAAIAAIQTTAQAYLPPRFNWLISDHFDGTYAAQGKGKKEATGLTADSLAGILPPLDNPSEPIASPTLAPTQKALPEPAMSDFDLDAFMEANGLEATEVARTEPVVSQPTDESALEDMEAWNDAYSDMGGMLN